MSTQHPSCFSSAHFLLVLALLSLVGCGSRQTQPPQPSPVEIQRTVVKLLPGTVKDRQGWATDIQVAFTTQKLDASVSNLCSVLAVTEQESTYQADPQVPGLGKIARQEIDRRASRLHIPGFLVSAALDLQSPSGKTYNQRLAAVRSEKQLSAIFDDFIGMVPLGGQLFGTFNPVHTGGPMQVSIAFAEQHARDYPYTYNGTLRQEVFTRRGGLYFGTLHLLGYPADYPEPLYRFADFNAGWYASRNAAFQRAVSQLTGIELTLDGDLLVPGSLLPSSTEKAVRTLGKRLGLGDTAIRRALEKGESQAFEETDLYADLFALADQRAGKPVPRAVLPGITLKSPKITRNLTTAWFAKRVDERYQRCVQRGGK
ncbi:DUF1615 domain-containing protein [Pseudomonas turukhanskensis]|uniref:DUF1615 domain-containing protein n=1 Tax=Pseudomonas turukhanskensis TaxID=1806536 RepID=A0A9W6K0M1_9PSED|nr:DUF1615 domain-containing protein [Pseudomonas turukhanskensis]GLK87330.1 hypothetical protein GCM10017655_03920 [Pseudomonas turukhanskensis]